MRKRHLLASLMSTALVVTALPALTAAQDEEPFAAEEVEWTLQAYDSGTGPMEVPEGVEATMLLSGGDVGGSAGCNQYFGSYEIDATTLTIAEPLGVTRALCDGPEQEVEDAFLPLLQATAGWSIEEGLLSLTDAEGATTLTFREAPIEITASDVAELAVLLADLQLQIDEATAEIEALNEAASQIDVKAANKRVKAIEGDVKALQQTTKGLNVSNLKNRLSTVEKAVAELDKQIGNIRKRVKAVEATTADHEARIAALESPQPEQPLP